MTGTGFVTGAAAQSASAQSGLSYKIYPRIAADLKEGKYAPEVKQRREAQ